MGMGRGERLSGAGWDPGWEAETRQQNWTAATSAQHAHGLHTPRTLRCVLEPAKPILPVKVQTLLGQLRLFSFYALLPAREPGSNTETI